MSNNNESEKDVSKLMEMVVRGRNYRETEDLEMFGETVEIILRPLVDAEFLPISALLQQKFDMDDEQAVEAIEEAKEEAEEDGEEYLDISQFDEEFVELMKKAAIRGIDGEAMGHDDEDVKWMVENMVGGFSVEIGGMVLEVSGDIRDAEKFPGGRGGN